MTKQSENEMCISIQRDLVSDSKKFIGDGLAHSNQRNFTNAAFRYYLEYLQKLKDDTE